MSPSMRPAFLSNRVFYGLLGGLVSLPLLALSSWQSGNEYSLSAVLLGGIVAGYLYRGGRKESQRAGLLAGAVGGLPLVWLFRDVLLAVFQVPNPAWFRVVSLFMLVGAVGFAVGLAAVAGMFGGMIGNWVATRRGRQDATAN
jgi:hypothetical protein